MITQDGLLYQITHVRARDEEGNALEYGGATLAAIVTVEAGDDGEPVYTVMAEGEATCSRKDRFDRRMGRQIAMGRARVALLGRPGRPTPTV